MEKLRWLYLITVCNVENKISFKVRDNDFGLFRESSVYILPTVHGLLFMDCSQVNAVRLPDKSRG